MSNQLDLPRQAISAMSGEDKVELPSGRAMWLARRIQGRIEQADARVRRDVMMADQYLGAIDQACRRGGKSRPGLVTLLGLARRGL